MVTETEVVSLGLMIHKRKAAWSPGKSMRGDDNEDDEMTIQLDG